MLGFRFTVNTVWPVSVPEFMREYIVFCSINVYDVVVKQFTFAISSPDELLVIL